ncbi:MAG: hypothetical protein AAFX56_20980 [Pseudomonadota bacterium]
MKTTLAAIAMAALSICAGTATADSAEQPAQVSFADVDANADMYIDKQEFEQFSEKARESVRKRVRERFQSGRGATGERAAKLYADADADKDGLLNEAEFAALQESVRAMREKMRQRFAEMGQSG